MAKTKLEQIISPAIDKLPPQSLEAEASVLGSLILANDAINRIADMLIAQDFYKRTNQIIYSAILYLFEQGEPVDVLSVSSRLTETKELENIGGISLLTSLVNSVPTSSHVVHYAKIVRKKRILRQLIEASHEIAALGWRESEDVEKTLDEAEKKIFSISQQSLQQEFLGLKSALEDAFNRIDKLHRGDGALRGVPTGFSALDNILAGLQNSDLIILASRPSLGKTTLALDIARNVAKSGTPVGIFSLEMSKEQLVDRLIASEAGVDLWRLRTGKLSMDGDDNDLGRIQEAMGVLAEAPIFIDDAVSATILQMRTMARRLKSEHNVGLIIVDYLQLMEGRGDTDNRVQQISEISRSLKHLARELDIPVLALSQLSRAVESRSPQIPKLSDLRESGSIEQDADVVMFIYREDREKRDSEKKNIAEIHIAKHRNGPVGKIDLYFDEKRVTFRTIERHQDNT